MAMFEGYDRRIAKITKTLDKYGFESLDAAKEYVLSLIHISCGFAFFRAAPFLPLDFVLFRCAILAPFFVIYANGHR